MNGACLVPLDPKTGMTIPKLPHLDLDTQSKNANIEEVERLREDH